MNHKTNLVDFIYPHCFSCFVVINFRYSLYFDVRFLLFLQLLAITCNFVQNLQNCIPRLWGYFSIFFHLLRIYNTEIVVVPSTQSAQLRQATLESSPGEKGCLCVLHPSLFFTIISFHQDVWPFFRWTSICGKRTPWVWKTEIHKGNTNCMNSPHRDWWARNVEIPAKPATAVWNEWCSLSSSHA